MIKKNNNRKGVLKMTIEENVLKLAKHLAKIFDEEEDICKTIGIELEGKSSKEKWKIFLRSQHTLYAAARNASGADKKQADIDIVEYVNILNRLAIEIMIEDATEDVIQDVSKKLEQEKV